MIEIKDSGERTEFSTGAVLDIHETWRDCVGYEGLYQVSDAGRVRSLWKNTRIIDKESKIMRQKEDQRGYFRVNLRKGGKSKSELVSRLVAKTFIPNPRNLPIAGHSDDNKKNNHVSNLYWTDSKENNHHNGKMERFQKKRNEKIHVIADKLSIPVEAIDEKTGTLIRFKSMQEAARSLGCKSEKICMCCKGLRERHFGYKWRYANEN